MIRDEGIGVMVKCIRARRAGSDGATQTEAQMWQPLDNEEVEH